MCSFKLHSLSCILNIADTSFELLAMLNQCIDKQKKLVEIAAKHKILSLSSVMIEVETNEINDRISYGYIYIGK